MIAFLLAQDADELALLTLVLQRAGFSVRPGRDLEQVIQGWTEKPGDLALLAGKRSVLPGQVARLRAETDAPLVVIVEHLEEDGQLALLEAGADLVLLRPYSARLLIGQLRALMRRVGVTPYFSLPTLQVGDVTLDPGARTVEVQGRSACHLTQLEFRLLNTLMMHPGQVMPAELLVEHVWGYGGQGDRDLVRGLVKRLRAKVEPDPKHPLYVQTVPGTGYVFQD